MGQRPKALTPEQSPQHRLGYVIRELREARGMSMRELAARTFVSHSKVQRWENGERPPTGRDEVELIDRVLGSGGFLIELWQEIGRGASGPGHVSDSASHVSDTPLDLATAVSQAAPSDGGGILVPARLDDGTVVLVALDRRAALRTGVGIGAATVASATMPTATAIGASEDPFGFARSVTGSWSGLRLSRPFPDYGVDWQALIPGGRSMLGSQLSLQVHPARVESGRVVVSIPDRRRAEEFLTRPNRSLLVGAVATGDAPQFYVLDGRTARGRLTKNGGMYEVATSTAYVLDDLTYGILWAVANYDDALQADDQALAEARSDLKAYERLSASAVSREAAPGLNAVAHMWLGSDFCARHILRTLPDLPQVPAFWTREQRGEEASAWLVFDHKFPYLRETTKALGSSTRAFCIPEDVVRSSPRYERILLFLAVALMEAMGIHAQFTADPAYEAVEGFVVAPDEEAVIANWVRGDGMWHVDVTSRPSVVRDFSNAAQDVGAHSITAASTPAERLRALAQYLELPWSWLIQRCAQVSRTGSSGLIQSRSRLVSPAGIDTACQYVGSLPSDR